MELQEALNQILELKETLKEREQQIANLTNMNEEQKSQIEGYTGEINKLKENNMALFLKVSQQMEDDHEETSQENEQGQAVQTWDDFMNDW